MTIYKRGRFWHYDFQERGVRYGPKTTKCTNKKDAQAFEDSLRLKVRQQKLTGQSQEWTLGQALDAWWSEKLVNLRSSAAYDTRIKAIRSALGTDLPFLQVNSAAVLRFISIRQGLGRKPGTIRDEVAKIRSLWFWMKDAHPEVERTLEVTWKQPRASKKLRVLRGNEEALLLAHLDPDRPGTRRRSERQTVFDIAIFLLDTGARVGECIAATWTMIRWEAKMVDLTRFKTMDGGVTVSHIPLTDRCLEALQRRYDQRDKRSPYIFPSTRDDSDRVYRNREIRPLRTALDELGFNAPHLVAQYGSCTLHTLRHTYGTELARRGVPVQDIQRVMGHSNINTTMIYINLANEDGVDRVREAMSQRTNNSPNMENVSYLETRRNPGVRAA